MFSLVKKRQHKFIHPTLDFFVAGMVIALDLYYALEAESRVPVPEFQASEDFPNRVEMTAALETSTHLWGMSKDDSVEAAKAHGIFSFVLRKVESCQLATKNGCSPRRRDQSRYLEH